MKNQTFRKRFVERISYYLKNVFTIDNINKEFDLIYNRIKPEMKRNCLRWNYSYGDWERNAQFLKSIASSRIDQVKSATKKYFNLNQEEYDEYF